MKFKTLYKTNKYWNDHTTLEISFQKENSLYMPAIIAFEQFGDFKVRFFFINTVVLESKTMEEIENRYLHIKGVKE